LGKISRLRFSLPDQVHNDGVTDEEISILSNNSMNIKKMKECQVFVDDFRCNACGSCVEFCPDVFELDSVTGKARERISQVVVTDDLEQAIAYCPRKCIELTGCEGE